jgi:hypothetical protein
MKDLTNPRLIKLKGLLFLVLGLLASALLILVQPEWKTVALLGIAIWAFCRFYYFAFYVIEHYVDPEFRYSGLASFFVYLVTHPRPSVAAKPTDSSNITTNKGAAP